jgi:hypothetical protein
MVLNIGTARSYRRLARAGYVFPDTSRAAAWRLDMTKRARSFPKPYQESPSPGEWGFSPG